MIPSNRFRSIVAPMEPYVGERCSDVLRAVQRGPKPGFVNVDPCCVLFAQSTQNPGIVPALMPELDGLRVLLERGEQIGNVVPITL